MDSIVGRAKQFAFVAHNAINQRRKYTGEPYTEHLERVAKLVENVDHDANMLAAAYLHDTVEDTATTIEDITAEFGEDIAYLVLHLTDVSRPQDGNRAVRKTLEREHIASGVARVHTVKLADLIDNSESIQSHDAKYAKVYMEEKRLLLTVLADGDPKLFERASRIGADWNG